MAETRIILTQHNGKVRVKVEFADTKNQQRTDALALVGLKAIRQAMEGKS